MKTSAERNEEWVDKHSVKPVNLKFYIPEKYDIRFREEMHKFAKELKAKMEIPTPDPVISKLSEREYEIFTSILDGATYLEMAEAHDLSRSRPQHIFWFVKAKILKNIQIESRKSPAHYCEKLVDMRSHKQIWKRWAKRYF